MKRGFFKRANSGRTFHTESSVIGFSLKGTALEENSKSLEISMHKLKAEWKLNSKLGQSADWGESRRVFFWEENFLLGS